MKYYNVIVYNTATQTTELEFDCKEESTAKDGLNILVHMLVASGGKITFKNSSRVVIGNYIIKYFELPVTYIVLKDNKVVYCGKNPTYTIDLNDTNIEYTVKRYPESFIEETGAYWDIDIKIL